MKHPRLWAFAAAYLLEHGGRIHYRDLTERLHQACVLRSSRSEKPWETVKEVLTGAEVCGQQIFQHVGEGCFILKDGEMAAEFIEVKQAAELLRRQCVQDRGRNTCPMASNHTSILVAQPDASSQPSPSAVDPPGDRSRVLCPICGAEVGRYLFQQHLERHHQSEVGIPCVFKAEQTRCPGKPQLSTYAVSRKRRNPPIVVPPLADVSPRVIFVNPLVKGASQALQSKKVRGDHK